MNVFNRLLSFGLIGALAIPALASAATTSAEKILPNTIAVDTAAHTAVFPLHRGEFRGKSAWYIVTDSSDAAVAKRNRAVYSPALASIGDDATQHASVQHGVLRFAGIPDFSPVRTYVASPGGFPPKSATPGSVADAQYSPFIHVDGTPGVLNAPIVAIGDGALDVTTHTNTEDRVIAIDTKAKTVTLALARGFVNDRSVLYLSTEASDPVAASVERATYVPKLAKASAGSTIPIGVVVNGPQSGPAPQGLAYLALRTPLSSDATAANAASVGSPLNVLSLVPNVSNPYGPQGYSPLWGVNVVGTAQAKRVTSFGAYSSLGAKPAGFVVNCPVVAFGG